MSQSGYRRLVSRRVTIGGYMSVTTAGGTPQIEVEGGEGRPADEQVVEGEVGQVQGCAAVKMGGRWEEGGWKVGGGWGEDGATREEVPGVDILESIQADIESWVQGLVGRGKRGSRVAGKGDGVWQAQ